MNQTRIRRKYKASVMIVLFCLPFLERIDTTTLVCLLVGCAAFVVGSVQSLLRIRQTRALDACYGEMKAQRNRAQLQASSPTLLFR
jgi:hypothetical protein